MQLKTPQNENERRSVLNEEHRLKNQPPTDQHIWWGNRWVLRPCEGCFFHPATGAMVLSPPSPSDLFYFEPVDTNSPEMVFRRQIAMTKGRIPPPNTKGWTDKFGKGWVRIHPDEMYVTPDGNWAAIPHPDARKKDQHQRPAHTKVSQKLIKKNAPPASHGWTSRFGKGWVRIHPDHMYVTPEGIWKEIPAPHTTYHRLDDRKKYQHQKQDHMKFWQKLIKKISPPALRVWTDRFRKGRMPIRPDHMYVTPEGLWAVIPDPHAPFSRLEATKKDQLQRQAHRARAEQIIRKIDQINTTRHTQGPQMKIRQSF